jgi:glycosyltransferase involved in cell wall biosynthesis
MLRYGNLVRSELCDDRIKIEEIHPKPYIQKLCPGAKWRKWGGYLDKYFLFPKTLSRLLKKKFNSVDLIHVVDHSNSVYFSKIPNQCTAKKLITCHDLIAIRTAQGEFPQAPRTSTSGKRLQRWIKQSLELADFYACVSSETEKELNRVIPGSKGHSKVIHNGVEQGNHAASPKNSANIPFNPSETPYLLHVGSSAWYKNRTGVFRAFKSFCEQADNSLFKMVFVGPEIQVGEAEKEERNWIMQNKHRVIALPYVTETELHLLYRHTKTFLFPSFVEGFGWPPIEASVRGCNVVTSKTGAISDILGDSATYVDPTKQEEINQALLHALSTTSPSRRAKIPTAKEFAKGYANLYLGMIKNGF